MLVIQRTDSDRSPPIDNSLHLQPTPHARRRRPSGWQRAIRWQRGRGTRKQPSQPSSGVSCSREQRTRGRVVGNVAIEFRGRNGYRAKCATTELTEPRRSIQGSLHTILEHTQTIPSLREVDQA